MASNIDPDYEPVCEQLETGSTDEHREINAKDKALKKITAILDKQFTEECISLEQDIYEIDKRLNECRLMLDRLRACIVISYYEKSIQKTPLEQKQESIHPAVKEVIGKSIPKTIQLPTSAKNLNISQEREEKIQPRKKEVEQVTSSIQSQNFIRPSGHESSEQSILTGKTKHRIVVGNVSKYLPAESRDERDRATHKWMVYVRGSRDRPNLSHIVEKVWFFLHPSYKPNDLVEVTSYPFHLTRRGWGEFPVRVQVHLKDVKSRKVDIIHLLKLDRTYTGLQTVGSETHVDVEIEHLASALEKYDNKVKAENLHGDIQPNNHICHQKVEEQTIIHTSPAKRIKLEQQIGCNGYREENSKLSIVTPNPTATSVVSKPAAAKLVSLLKLSPVNEMSNHANSVLGNLNAKEQSSAGSSAVATKIAKGIPIYVRCKTADGKIMLLRKSLVDKLKAPNIASTLANSNISAKFNSRKQITVNHHPPVAQPKITQLSSVESKIVIPVVSHVNHKDLQWAKSSTNAVYGKAVANTVPNWQRTVDVLPVIDNYPTMESLVERLVRNDPIIGEDDESNSPLHTVSRTVYHSWPLGKRRAFEWQRAKRVNVCLTDLLEKSSFLREKQPWSSKRILVWCRRNLYTPLADCDSLFPGKYKESCQSQLNAEQIMESCIALRKNESDCSVDIETIQSPRVISKTPAGDDDLTPQTLSQIYIQSIAKQVGVVLPAFPSTLLWRFHEKMAEIILRKAYASKCSRCSGDEGEITVLDLQKLILNCQNLQFLRDI